MDAGAGQGDARHVAVVGAGIVGVSTAIWLRRAGLRVTLIDREGPAAGTSHGNAGILAAISVVPVPVPGLLAKAPKLLFDPMQPLFLRWAHLPRLIPFLRRYLANANDAAVERISTALAELLGDAADQHLALAAGTGAERHVKPGDYLFVYSSRAAFEAESYAWAIRRRRGYEWEELDEAGLAAFDPALKGRFGFAVRCPGHGAVTDPGAYVKALWRHFEGQGGETRIAALTDVRLEAGRATALLTETGPIEADEFVIATGAWSGALAARLGVAVPLESERGYHVEYWSPSLEFRAPTMVAEGKFGMTSMEGRLRAAGVVEFGGLEAPASEAPFRLIERRVAAALPDLKSARTERWMGHRPATADSLPVIGRAPKAANVWFGYGHQHVGLTAGPKTGRWLAQLVRGERPNVDLAPFAPDRPAAMQD